ncbi:MAG: RluA family pseudouridine synthase [Treponema sp.]|jgi:23S rRNA pseudouridine1911/1915/1917 synthase|nr:RluA family pseudouridine synthase [Treponema sp.]
MPFYSIQVPSDYYKNERLDKYVSIVSNGMNRSKLKSGIVEILVNGKKSKLSQKVKNNDQIDIQWEDNIPENIDPENIPLDILFENEDVTVVNKAQGMVTHPACGNWNGTLVNALLYHWGRKAINQIKDGSADEVMTKRRPGIVHRLDKDTSGIIITAKNRDSEEWLQSQFKNRNLQKEYICICFGRPKIKCGDIRTQIIRDPKNRHRFKAVTETKDGKYARTLYSCISCYGNYSLMRVRIKTGRTHQIRVHMKYLGCPILGDSIYNSEDKLFPKATLMLHSKKLKILLPNDSKLTEFNTKTPKRFLEVEKKLKSKYQKEILNKTK